MQIRDLDPEAHEDREVCAQLLVDEFRVIAPDAWPVIDKARETVDECLRSGPVRVAQVNGTIVGWIGGIGGSGAACSVDSVAPVSWMLAPPVTILPESASDSDLESASSFAVFTEEIANSTMNSVMSSVIMSAYVSSQRSSLSCSSS